MYGSDLVMARSGLVQAVVRVRVKFGQPWSAVSVNSQGGQLVSRFGSMEADGLLRVSWLGSGAKRFGLTRSNRVNSVKLGQLSQLSQRSESTQRVNPVDSVNSASQLNQRFDTRFGKEILVMRHNYLL
ncbi:hypothetical protein Hdeb2414_s0001g00025471 [Helianthus debilis subsp. tardiflorus]